MTPDEFTNQESWLVVGDDHQLYVHDWGNADAKIPVVFLHGGPGNGCDNRDKKKFNPATQRVIFHDQRGAGKSTPAGSLQHNTTPDLVADIHKIVQKLKLKQFILAGGSWGSCLALAYALAHPEPVAGLVLNGVFTASHWEQAWLEGGEYRSLFPDVWEKYLASTPEQYHDNPTAYHFKQVQGKDPAAAKKSAYAYQNMEAGLVKLDDRFQPDDYATFDPATIMTEMHFAAHDWFMEEDYLVRNAARLTRPVYLVQGRYDMVCPPATAYKLHTMLPNSRLIWTVNGHLAERESVTVQRLLLEQLAGTA